MEKELGRPPSEAELFIETRKKKIKPQGEKTINLIGALEELRCQDEVDDAWDLVKKDEHPGRKADLVHGFAELLTETLGQTIDPTAITRLVARTRSTEEGNSARNHDRPRSSGSSHHPRNEKRVEFVEWSLGLFEKQKHFALGD
ncbi:uncharacterized protein A4U43_C07F90 [Asparagus officinalis]|uniref:Uncharacterized protein n=1 Tax=Asparagus officinalis TaxID=4686 RepID=A0A5P1E8C8_ASPOF|nr:uncharacterized protein A4U43_C07F90 [Asparagus officinalis]